MERRKFLIGAGSLAAGSAAAVGTGAFTSVQADRTLSIEVAGDASAFLSIEKASTDPEDGQGEVYPNAEEYVDISESGEVSLDFTQTDDTEGSSGSGINRDAKTVFDNLLDITNNGTQDIEVGVVGPRQSGAIGQIGVYAENTQGDSSDNLGFEFEDEPATLSPGGSVTNIGVYIPDGADLSQLEDVDLTLTIKAVRTGGNQD